MVVALVLVGRCLGEDRQGNGRARRRCPDTGDGDALPVQELPDVEVVRPTVVAPLHVGPAQLDVAGRLAPTCSARTDFVGFLDL